ncbi:MAG: phosphoribosyltransferase family protein [Deltaproteobacteria bacterium]
MSAAHAALAWLGALAHDVLDLVAPRECAACLAPHPSFPPPPFTPALCAVCASALGPAEDPPRDVIVPYAHGGPLADAIHRAKYGDDPLFASALGNVLAHAARSQLVTAGRGGAGFDVAVAVPLHPRRLSSRGFNQSVEIARALRCPIVFGSIERMRDTPSQVGLDRPARAVNVRAAFAVRDPRPLRGRHVLVVDDVVTTGATLAEVVAQAHAAGARRVTAMALARAPLDHTRSA